MESFQLFDMTYTKQHIQGEGCSSICIKLKNKKEMFKSAIRNARLELYL
jgi:hypothetical protein